MGRRLALLIATYLYQDSGLRQLTSPAHDAEGLAAVLGDPAIAGFEVTTLINEPHHRVGQAIGDFYRARRRDDLTLLYFTGHGLKDDDGRLYLAMTNTQRDNLLFTGLPAEQVDQAMESCVSRQKVLVLDCCYSGAFPARRLAKADTAVHALERFQGRGRTVLTASDATQYSFEGDQPHGQAVQSVFTHHLVAGLRDGSADLDGDGDITLDELYSYVHDQVVAEMPHQRPKKQDNVEGRTVIARNINWTLPSYLRNAVVSPIAADRLAALEGLAHLYRIGNDLVRSHVQDQIHHLTDDDSKLVSAAATTLQLSLTPEPHAPSPEPVDIERVDTERPETVEPADSPHAEDVGHGNLPTTPSVAETDPPTTAVPTVLKAAPTKRKPHVPMVPDNGPALSESIPGDEHRSRAPRLTIVGGILALASMVLMFNGARLGMGILGTRYLNLFAAVTVIVGSCVVAPRTRSMVGPGMLLGLAIAAIWGGVGFGLELPQYPWYQNRLLIIPAGHATLYVAALLVVVPMFVKGSIRIQVRRTPDSLTWAQVGLLTAASWGVGTALLVLDADNQLFQSSYLVAAVLANNVPLLVAVLVPRKFGLSVLAGWLAGLWVVWSAANANVDYPGALNANVGLPVILASGGTILILTLVSAAVAARGVPRVHVRLRPGPVRRPLLRIAAYIAVVIVVVSLAVPGIVSFFTHEDSRGPTLLAHDGEVLSMAFSPDGRTLATGSNDGRVRLWNLANGETIVNFETGALNPIFAFSRNANTVAVASENETTVRLWNITTGDTSTIGTNGKPIRSVALSPDGNTVAAAVGTDGTSLWYTNTGQHRATLPEPYDSVFGDVAFSPNGKTLATVGHKDGLMRVWNVDTGQVTTTISPDPGDLFGSVQFGPDSKTLATNGYRSTKSQVWDIDTGQATTVLTGRTTGILAFSPDGKTLATTSNDRDTDDNQAQLRNTATGKTTATLIGHTDYVRCADFSPDGKTLATGSFDHHVRLWNVDTGQAK